jgi:hypothetical protein
MCGCQIRMLPDVRWVGFHPPLQMGLLWPCPQIQRPDWKGFLRANPLAYWASSLLGLVVSDEGKNISTWPDGGSTIPDLSDERLIRRVSDENLHLDSDVERRIRSGGLRTGYARIDDGNVVKPLL